MIYELVLVLCLSTKECVVDSRQMRGEQCLEEAAEMVRRYGRDPDQPPYLRDPPVCAYRGEA